MLSFFGVMFFCILVLSPLIPHLKWYNEHLCRDLKQSTALFELLSRVDNFFGILRKPQINYFSKTAFDGYFMLTSGISVKSVPQQGWKFRRANHGAKHWKIWFFCIISTALTETGGGEAIALFYRKTLQVCFWKIRI